MLKPNLSDYSDVYIVGKETITISNTAGAAHDANNTNKKAIIKVWAPFTDCISEINNTEIDNAKDIDAVMSMYHLKEWSNNYSKTSGSLWQNYRNEPAWW